MIKRESELATAILTVVRSHASIDQLNMMSRYGEDTPVSGDALTRQKAGFGQQVPA